MSTSFAVTDFPPMVMVAIFPQRGLRLGLAACCASIMPEIFWSAYAPRHWCPEASDIPCARAKTFSVDPSLVIPQDPSPAS